MTNTEDQTYEFEGIFETIPCKCADQLLEIITDKDRPWHKWGHLKWIWRGQNEYHWLLEPSLHRLKTGTFSTSLDNILLETYIREGNVAGLDIPPDTKMIHYPSITMNRTPLNGYRQLALDDILVAHAQHHGIPTRLLDFTYNPFVATWFAADPTESMLNVFGLSGSGAHLLGKVIDLINEIGKKNSVESYIRKGNHLLRQSTMAIWAINSVFLEAKTNLRLIDKPYTRIGYLKAQSGCFVVDTSPLGSKVWKNEIALEYELQKLDRSQVFRLTLPASCRSDLLGRLSNYGVRRTSIYPDWHSVADDVMGSIREPDPEPPSQHVRIDHRGYKYSSGRKTVRNNDQISVSVPMELSKEDPYLANCQGRVKRVFELRGNSDGVNVWYNIEGRRLCVNVERLDNGNNEDLQIGNPDDDSCDVQVNIHENGKIDFRNCLGEDANLVISVAQRI